MASLTPRTEIANYTGDQPVRWYRSKHIRDSKYDGDAVGWAEHIERPEMRQVFEADVAGL